MRVRGPVQNNTKAWIELAGVMLGFIFFTNFAEMDTTFQAVLSVIFPPVLENIVLEWWQSFMPFQISSASHQLLTINNIPGRVTKHID